MNFLFVEEKQQEVPQHRQSSDQIRVPAARLVFQQAGIFAPVVADFTAAPMAANQVEPLLRHIGVHRTGGHIIADLLFAAFRRSGEPAHLDDGLHMRKAYIRRFDFPEADVA